MSAVAATAESSAAKRSWLPLMILGAAQFVMVLDSSVMNVSISQIVHDLNTSIQGVQTAITMYTLVMAAFMLVGAKLGDMYGRDRIFAIGLAIYACGSLITALSPNLTVLLLGWSLIEGLGAVMVIPAIAALIASNYEGKQRALAYGVIGGVAGAAIAAGPLIGGCVTTEFSWRYVFAGEVVIVIGSAAVPAADDARAARRAQAEARCRRRGALRARFRPRRVRDPAEQHLGLDPAEVAADDRRARDDAVRLLAGAVLHPRRARLPRALQVLGGATGTAGQGRVPQARARAHPAARSRALDARDDAARPARDVLRAAGLPAGGAGFRCVRHRKAAVPDVDLDADCGARRAAAGHAASPRSGCVRSGSSRWRSPRSS